MEGRWVGEGREEIEGIWEKESEGRRGKRSVGKGEGRGNGSRGRGGVRGGRGKGSRGKRRETEEGERPVEKGRGGEEVE